MHDLSPDSNTLSKHFIALIPGFHPKLMAIWAGFNYDQVLLYCMHSLISFAVTHHCADAIDRAVEIGHRESAEHDRETPGTF